MNTISWATPTTPLPMEINPRAAFERLFGDGGSAEQRRAARQEDRSILDSIPGEARGLQGAARRARSHARRRLPRQRPRDRAAHSAGRDAARAPMLDAHRHAARHPRLVRGAHRADVRPAGAGAPGGPDARVHVHDVARVAASGRSRRSASPSRSTSCRTTATSRRRSRAQREDQHLCLRAVRASSSRSCSTTPDGDGSLLDHSLIFYGSGMGNSNVHATDPLPMVAVGGGVGTGNRHLVLPPKTEIGNLWLSVANKFGADVPSSARARARSTSSDAGENGYRQEADPDSGGAVMRRTAAAASSQRSPTSSRRSKSAMRSPSVQLIERRQNVNVAEADGTTALMWAVRDGDSKSRRCCSRPAPTSTQRTATERRALSLAVDAGKPAAARPAAESGRGCEGGGVDAAGWPDAADARCAGRQRRRSSKL